MFLLWKLSFWWPTYSSYTRLEIPIQKIDFSSLSLLARAFTWHLLDWLFSPGSGKRSHLFVITSRRSVSHIPAVFAALSPVVWRAWSPYWESCCWEGEVYKCYIKNPPLSKETPSTTIFLAKRSLYPCLPTLEEIITLINIFNPFETDSYLRLTVNAALKSGLRSPRATELSQMLLKRAAVVAGEQCSDMASPSPCRQCISLLRMLHPPSAPAVRRCPALLPCPSPKGWSSQKGHRSRQLKILMPGHWL